MLPWQFFPQGSLLCMQLTSFITLSVNLSLKSCLHSRLYRMYNKLWYQNSLYPCGKIKWIYSKQSKTIGNQHGKQLLSPSPFSIAFDAGQWNKCDDRWESPECLPFVWPAWCTWSAHLKCRNVQWYKLLIVPYPTIIYVIIKSTGTMIVTPW